MHLRHNGKFICLIEFLFLQSDKSFKAKRTLDALQEHATVYSSKMSNKLKVANTDPNINFSEREEFHNNGAFVETLRFHERFQECTELNIKVNS